MQKTSKIQNNPCHLCSKNGKENSDRLLDRAFPCWFRFGAAWSQGLRVGESRCQSTWLGRLTRTTKPMWLNSYNHTLQWMFGWTRSYMLSPLLISNVQRHIHTDPIPTTVYMQSFFHKISGPAFPGFLTTWREPYTYVLCKCETESMVVGERGQYVQSPCMVCMYGALMLMYRCLQACASDASIPQSEI